MRLNHKIYIGIIVCLIVIIIFTNYNKETSALGILNLLSILINIAFTYLNYNSTEKKNSIDIIPYFDININQIQVEINPNYENKYKMRIPLFNIGNGTAINIHLKSESNLENILYDTAIVNNQTYYEFITDISYNDKNINFEIFFSDFNQIQYKQNFELSLDIKSNMSYDKIEIARIYYNNSNLYNNPCLYFYFNSKNVQQPLLQ